jgi:hypothetical protein
MNQIDADEEKEREREKRDVMKPGLKMASLWPNALLAGSEREVWQSISVVDTFKVFD